MTTTESTTQHFEVRTTEEGRTRPLKFVVVAIGEDGAEVKLPRTLSKWRERAQRFAELLKTCHTCREQIVEGRPGPTHDGASFCRCGSIFSGGQNAHCACSSCW
jgi:hypothetical protein